MTDENKKKLILAGRPDLVRIHELNASGYAGVTAEGELVDRRYNPDAIPVQKNSIFGTPTPKDLNPALILLCEIHSEWAENWDKVVEFFGQDITDKIDIIVGYKK